MNIVSLSGGKDSTAMLIYMLEHGIPVDDIVFCDTGMEFPQLYEHLDKVEAYTGRKITRLHAEHSFQYWFCEHVKTKGKSAGERGYGWPSVKRRWCTSFLKRRVFDRYIKGKRNIHRYIGFAYDEGYRVQRKGAQDDHYRFPLYEARITEAEALKMCYDRGFDFGGLYKLFARLGCYCCPLQRMGGLEKVYTYFPELWANMKALQKAADGISGDKRWRFRPEYSLDELEARFTRKQYYEQRYEQLDLHLQNTREDNHG